MWRSSPGIIARHSNLMIASDRASNLGNAFQGAANNSPLLTPREEGGSKGDGATEGLSQCWKSVKSSGVARMWRKTDATEVVSNT
jgi:hypothetical protein